MEKELKPSGGPKKKTRQSCMVKVECNSKLQANALEVNDSHPTQNTGQEIDDDEINKTSYWNFIFCPFVVALCICFVSPVILIPQHDGLLYPDYWYELIINANLSFCLGLVIMAFHDIRMILNIPSVISKWFCFKSYIVLILSKSVHLDAH